MTKSDTDLIPPKPCNTEAEKWLQENHAAMVAYNDWIAKNGLPLEKYRQF